MDRRDRVWDLRRDIMRALDYLDEDSRPLDNRVYNPVEVARIPSAPNVLRRTLLLLEELT